MTAQDTEFERKSFGSRLKSMLKVDVRRVFQGYFFYIMAAVCLVIPIAVLVMTSMNAGGGTGDLGITNVWQMISSLSTDSSMSLTTMCGLNLAYFLILVYVSALVSEDFRSGYAKNLFSVRARKGDYAASKILVTTAAGILMMVCFFVGALIGGKISGLSFALDGATAAGVVCCLLSKFFLVPLFAALAVVFGCTAKKRTWLAVLLSVGVGMFLWMIVPMMTPLDAGVFQIVLCLAGGILFAGAFGVLTGVILNRTNLA